MTVMDRVFCIYDRMEAGRPKIVTFTPTTPEERTTMPHAIIARLPFNAQPNGLPADGELKKVGEIEDKLEVELKSVGALYIGHVNFNGSMFVLFYARQPAPARVSIKVGLFKKTEIALESRHDPNWQVFELEMSPTEHEGQVIRNQKLLETLRTHGDNHQKVRDVDCAARFSAEADRAAFLDDVQRVANFVKVNETWEPEPDDFWCEFVISTAVERHVIAALCLELHKLADARQGEFDGWACHVTS